MIALLVICLLAVQADDPEAEMEKIARKVVQQGKVCGDPEKPCPGFRPNELSFKIAKEFAFDRGRDRSVPFYAVILRSAELCSITEEERLKVQTLFPRQKVFVHRLHCEGFGDKVTYTNVNAKAGFIAVYAGEAEAEAKKMLAQVKATGRFPGANLRKMAAVVVYQLE